jgi:alpha(1,3/1,4) fucosyltransferase
MLVGGIVGWEEGQDDLFNPHSARNRDDCLHPFRVLRATALARGIQLHTLDVLHEKGVKPDFTLYLESLPVIPIKDCKNFLIRFETELTVPINGDSEYLKQFDGIYTWDQALLQSKSAPPTFPMCYPNALPSAYQVNAIVNPGFAQRHFFCTLIGSNRHANLPDSRELYSERVKAIRWFETHAPNDFALFGNGWLVPQKRLGGFGKLRYRLEKVLPFLLGKPLFPSYRGPAKTKFEVLSHARFSICFENAKDIPGYITEKLFDCLFAGCIPIYWGEPQIEHRIPQNCFIDFRLFLQKPDPYAALNQFLHQMTESEYLAYQDAGKQFLASPAFMPYSSQAFAETILGPIKS